MDDSWVSRIQQEAATADEAGRLRLQNALRDLQYSMETPEDTMQRVIHLHLHYSSIRTALDLKLFNLLVDSKEPLTLDYLATKTSADPVLLGRLLRQLAGLGVIKEVGKDKFTFTRTTENLAIPEIQAGCYINYDVYGPVYQHLPFFLAENGYQNVTSLTDGVFQSAWKTNPPLFTWLYQNTEHTTRFNLFMKAQRSSTPNCFNFYPIEEECRNWSADKPVFVDIGGGSGHQCIALKAKFPNLPGRVILQDLEKPIEEARLQVPRSAETMVHDFFTPQPVKGAKYYFLSAILHDHADDKCQEILKNIIPALEKDSVILLNESVLPNEGVSSWSTQTDLTMMVAVGGMERTEAQWEKLLGSVGLRIRDIYTYTAGHRLSIIVAML